MALPSLGNHNSGTNSVGRDPLHELDRLNRRLATLVESWTRLPELLNGRPSPLVDLEETDDAYLIEIEMPGVDRGDIDVEIAGRQLFVHAERKEKRRVGVLRRRERIIGEFTCAIGLPGAASDDGVEANIDAGVLTVRVPKAEHETRCRVGAQMNWRP